MTALHRNKTSTRGTCAWCCQRDARGKNGATWYEEVDIGDPMWRPGQFFSKRIRLCLPCDSAVRANHGCETPDKCRRADRRKTTRHRRCAACEEAARG